MALHRCSLDKHFIGKETTPLDDDNELIDDEEPVLECNDLVLRSTDRNLKPLVDAGLSSNGVRSSHSRKWVFSS